MSSKDGGPAFPLTVNDGKTVNWNVGMTLRDYFAAKAMQGIIAKSNLWMTEDKSHEDFVEFMRAAATGAYQYADAMLKAREEQ